MSGRALRHLGVGSRRVTQVGYPLPIAEVGNVYANILEKIIAKPR